MINNTEAYCTDFHTEYNGNKIRVESRMQGRNRLYINDACMETAPGNVLAAQIPGPDGNTEELRAVLEGGGFTECHIYVGERLIYSSQEDWEELAAEAQAKAREEAKKSKWLLAAALLVSVAMVATYSMGFFFADGGGLQIPVLTKIKDVAWQWFGMGDGPGSGPVDLGSGGSAEGTDDANEAHITTNYVWAYGRDQWTYSLKIPVSVYQYYRGLDRTGIYDYSYFVKDTTDDAYMASLTEAFRTAAAEEEYNDMQTVEFIVSFVQGLEYVSDLIGTGYDEYPKYPLETLADEGGDCEDSSILLASLLKEMGYGAVLIQTTGHMSVGILGDETLTGSYYEMDGKKYFYVETTAPGWDIGQLPPEVDGDSATLLGI